MAEVVYIRDRSSGRVHQRVRLGPGQPLQSFEADNADAAGEFDEITEAEVADADRDALCARCFPLEAPGADE
jgi:hypothetical protein